MQRSNWGLCATGSFAVAVGLIVLIGGHGHIAAFIQWTSSSAAMLYNAALGFLLCGIGMIAVGFGRSFLAGVTGNLVFTLGLATLGEYLFGLDFGIDQRLMADYFTPNSAAPGRMAFTSALGFTCIG